MFKSTVSALLMLIVLVSAVWAQTSPSVINAEPVVNSAAMYYNHGSKVARTSDGKLLTAWSTTGSANIVAAQYDPSFGIWSEVVISSVPEGGGADKVSLAADDNGNVYAVWQQRDDSAQDYMVMMSKFDGLAWSAPVDLTGSLLENEEANVAVGNDGKVYVVWNTDSEADGSEWILCINSTDGGATWSTPDTLSDPNGFIGTSIEAARVNLARGSGGKMVASWFESTPDGQLEEIHMNQYDGSAWSGVMVVSDTTTKSNRYSTGVTDDQDNIYIAWRPQTLGGSTHLLIKSKAWDDTEWSMHADTVVAPGYIVSRPQMGIDENQTLYIAYQRDIPADTVYSIDEIAVVTSFDMGATWSEQVTLSRPNHDAGYNSLDPRITSSGVDMVWREGWFENASDPDSVAIVYGHVDIAVNGLEANPVVVSEYHLAQNYPNPFNPTTEIEFTVAENGVYKLQVFNMLGQRVTTLISGALKAGVHNASWNGLMSNGKSAASGVYFYRLSGKNVDMTRKMVLMR